MAEYIEREALLDSIGLIQLHFVARGDNKSLYDIINEQPAADVAPVVHGRWDRVKNPQWPAYSHDKCSICGWWNTKNALCYDGHKKPGHSLNYCPSCGAKMDGGKNDAADS